MRNFTRYVSVLSARLLRLPGSLGHHPALLFSPGLEGYRDYTFGGRSGPSIQTSGLFHELAHAAQFGPEQFAKRGRSEGFVFKMATIVIGGRRYEEPVTRQGTERELDTFAYQLHMMQAVGIKASGPDFMAYCARIMRFMPDWYHVPGTNDNERAEFCRSRIEERYNTLTQQDVLERLTGWLDATQRRLARKAEERPYRRVEHRYLGDGTLLPDDVPFRPKRRKAVAA